MSNLVATGLTSVLGAAGQAVVVAVGPCAGGYLVNPLAALSQGIPTPEELYVDPVAAPGSTDSAANGTCAALQPGETYTIPPLGAGQVLRVNAATAAHAFTVVVW